MHQELLSIYIVYSNFPLDLRQITVCLYVKNNKEFASDKRTIVLLKLKFNFPLKFLFCIQSFFSECMLSSGSELFQLATIVLIVVFLIAMLAVDIVFGCHVSKCVGVVWSGLNDFAFAKTQPLNMLVCRRHPIYIVVASIASPLIELQSVLVPPPPIHVQSLLLQRSSLGSCCKNSQFY